MNDMKTVQADLIPAKLLAELRAAADRVAKGVRDPVAMKKAARAMDRMREETRKQVGMVDVAVDLIRETRDDL